MPIIFLSYAAADRARVQPLVTALEAGGFDVWWDRDISLGESYHRVIEQALKRASCALVLWSHASVTSEWVANEASEARKRGILVPAFLDEVEPPLEFRHLQSASLSAWKGDADDPNLQQLIAAVRRVIQRDVAPPAVASAQAPVIARAARSWWETPAGWAVGGAALLLAISVFIFALRGMNSNDTSLNSPGGPPPASSGGTEPGASGPPGQSTASTSAPVAQPAGTGSGAIDLFNLRDGSQILAANEAGWNGYLYKQSEPTCTILSTNGFAVFAFRDERPARFDRLGVFIEATNPYNVKTVELQASIDSERGPFQSVGRFSVPNFRNEREPFHEFTFEPVTARYVKIVILDWQEHSGPNGNVCTMRLMGTLQ
jgi:hypothetical protein